MPDRRWFTVSFPTPLVFCYHLPLNNQNPKNLTMEWMCAKNCFLSLQDEPVKEWRVAHYQQKYHWDCGLSCCIMVLPDHHKDHLMTNFSKVSISWSCKIITRIIWWLIFSKLSISWSCQIVTRIISWLIFLRWASHGPARSSQGSSHDQFF
jgi:hypothetical protein